MIEAWFDACTEPINPGGHAAYGVLIKVDGVTVLSEGKYIGHGPHISNNLGEYMGMLRILQELPKYPGPAIIRGDSKLVIMQLNKQWKVNGGRYFPVYQECVPLFEAERQRIRTIWIPREQNAECDRLSKKVLLDMGIQFKLQPEPSQQEQRRA
jgi:ribonuclease HI